MMDIAKVSSIVASAFMLVSGMMILLVLLLMVLVLIFAIIMLCGVQINRAAVPRGCSSGKGRAAADGCIDKREVLGTATEGYVVM